MKTEYLYLPLGGLIELLGIFTLLTNEESFLPHVEIGFEIPVLLLSADVQGLVLFALGSAITIYAITALE